MKILVTGARWFVGRNLCSVLGRRDDIKAGFEKFLSAPKHELQAFGNNMKTLLNKEYDRNKIIEQMTEEIFPLPISAQG